MNANKTNSFILGLLSINSLGGYNVFSQQCSKNDRENLESDWIAIGEDIKNAITQYNMEEL